MDLASFSVVLVIHNTKRMFWSISEYRHAEFIYFTSTCKKWKDKRSQRFPFTLAVDAEEERFGGWPMAATVHEAHHHTVVPMVRQVVELSREHIEWSFLFQNLLIVWWGSEELH